jgi:outer membrane protein assembly factor BamA
VRGVFLASFLVAGCAASPSRPAKPATCGAAFTSLSKTTPGQATIDRDLSTIVTSVRIVGVDDELARTLRLELATKAGMTLGEAPLRDDVRRLWKSGVVADATVELEGEGDVRFVVAPRSMIGKVTVLGGDRFMARRFRLLEGVAYEPTRLSRMAAQAQLAYVREGRIDAQVEAVSHVKHGRVDVCVVANPGPKVTIGAIEFPGRTMVSHADLVKAIASGDGYNRVGGMYDEIAFQTDVLRMTDVYWGRGYAKVHFGDPKVERRGDRMVITVPIREGEVFRIGTITNPFGIAIPVAPGDLFSREKIANARDKIMAETKRKYVGVRTKIDEARRTVDLVFEPEAK